MSRTQPVVIVIDGADGSGKDKCIEEAMKILLKEGLDVEVVKTTEPIEGNPDTVTARATLIAPATDPSNRFLAALYLYQANIQKAMRNLPNDVLLVYRGWAGFIVYNKIPWLSIQAQSCMIPSVDGAILITADFDTLTRRIKNRNQGNENEDASFQDTSLDYRLSVFREYGQVFKDLGEERKTPYLMVYNQDGSLDSTVKAVVDFIKQTLETKRKQEKVAYACGGSYATPCTCRCNGWTRETD